MQVAAIKFSKPGKMPPYVPPPVAPVEDAPF